MINLLKRRACIVICKRLIVQHLKELSCFILILRRASNNFACFYFRWEIQKQSGGRYDYD